MTDWMGLEPGLHKLGRVRVRMSGKRPHQSCRSQSAKSLLPRQFRALTRPAPREKWPREKPPPRRELNTLRKVVRWIIDHRVVAGFTQVSIIVAVVAFLLDMQDRVRERTVQAWQLLTTPACGNSGKIEALEYLASDTKFWPFESVPDRYWPLKTSDPLVGIDLSSESVGPKCGGVYLAGIDLSSAQIRDVTFANADLTSSNFEGTTLRNIKFENAQMLGASFEGANMAGVRFSVQQLIGTNFSRTSLGLPLSPVEFGEMLRELPTFSPREGEYDIVVAPYNGAQVIDLSGVAIGDLRINRADLEALDLSNTVSALQQISRNGGVSEYGYVDIARSRIGRLNLNGQQLSVAILSSAIYDIEFSDPLPGARLFITAGTKVVIAKWPTHGAATIQLNGILSDQAWSGLKEAISRNSQLRVESCINMESVGVFTPSYSREGKPGLPRVDERHFSRTVSPITRTELLESKIDLLENCWIAISDGRAYPRTGQP